MTRLPQGDPTRRVLAVDKTPQWGDQGGSHNYYYCCGCSCFIDRVITSEYERGLRTDLPGEPLEGTPSPGSI